MTPARFALDDEEGFAAFVKSTPRSVVLFRGVGCPYSAAFEPHFVAAKPPTGWALAVREVEDGGRGPVGDAYAIEITPTAIAFTRGKESSRLNAMFLIGMRPSAFDAWVKTL